MIIMAAVRRKAESGRIWKKCEEIRENQSQRLRKKRGGKSSTPDAFMIKGLNDKTYDILIRKSTGSAILV